MANYASIFFTRRTADTEAMEIDGCSPVKVGARKLYGTSYGYVEAVGLYSPFDRDAVLPAGKRGKFEEDVEMVSLPVSRGQTRCQAHMA